jgi:ABC-type sugar transport system ATPase subunit
LGRAVVRNPRIFLFDEPLSSLDAHQREGLRSEIIELHRRSGKTIVYVTHDQAEAMSVGHRVAVMNHGIIEQVAAPMELYHRPANRFVAGFIGSPAMTFLDGRIDDGVFRWHQSSLNVGDRVGQGPMTLGVRPEDWIVDTSGSPFVETRVESVQRLGPETLVQFNLNGVTAHVRLDPRCEVNGHDLLRLSIRQGHWHWFAPDGQQKRIGP